MTNTLTISRELLEDLINPFADFATHDKARAILDAPVVERQEPVHAILLSDCVEYWVRDYGRGHFGTLDCVTKLYTSPPAPVAVDDSTTSDKYRAELYDEVWQKARDMGFANVTDALERLDDIDGCPRVDKVKEMNR